jgi:hypothetical protein
MVRMRALVASGATLLALAASMAVAGGNHPQTNELDDAFKSTNIKTIAALPLYSDISDTDDPDHEAPGLVEGKFYSALNAGSGYAFYPSGEVQRVIDAKKMQSQLKNFYKKFTSDQEDVDDKFIKAVATEMKTDAVVAVVIDVWQQQPIDLTETGSARTSVGALVALFDGATGKRLWLGRDENYKEAVRHTGQNVSNPAENAMTRGQMDRTNLRTATGVYAPPPFADVVEVVVGALVEAFPKKAK